MRVLVIEDSPTQQEMIVRAIKKAGSEPVSADRWGLVINTVMEKPDLVIADWNVPDKIEHRNRSIAILEKMKIPFVILTAYFSDVPERLQKFAVAKAVDIEKQVSDILARVASGVEI